ncbi:MAG: NUDIX hydrolase [Clostridia bacterium]|nr:NUDIX hydrolase [Clostridia bacterium]
MQNFNDEKILEKNISRERMFDGIILHIDHVTNELPNGKHAKREIAVHVGVSAVLPVDGEGNVYLVRQFRAPIDQVLLEIPAGKLDSVDEDRLLAAKRELEEETGLKAGSWLHLTDTFTTPGFSNEKISLYLARDLVFGESRPDEDEFLNVVKIPFEEAFNMVMRDEIHDAKTQVALCMAKNLI